MGHTDLVHGPSGMSISNNAGHGLSPFCIGLLFMKNTFLSKDIKKQIGFFNKTQGNNH